MSFNDTKIAQIFQQLVSSASAILKVEQEKEIQWLENSFIHLIDKAKIILGRHMKDVSANLRHKFLTFLKQAQIVLRDNKRSELEECSKFLEKSKSAIYHDIQRKVNNLDIVLKQARPIYERVNIFWILNIERQEDPQSYFLAWLLDPGNPHGFGDIMLRTFLRKACDIVGEFDYSRLKITDVTITAQQDIGIAGVPDIEIVGDNFICVVENKVGAGETFQDGIPQTRRYADYYTEQKKKNSKFLLLLYLVPPRRHEDELEKQPSDKRFKTILYSDIVEIIESVLRTSTITSDVSSLVEMFLHNIKREICHEFCEYLEAEKLLRTSREISGEASYDSSYFARADRYEYLVRVANKISKEVISDG